MTLKSWNVLCYQIITGVLTHFDAKFSLKGNLPKIKVVWNPLSCTSKTQIIFLYPDFINSAETPNNSCQNGQWSGPNRLFY